MSARKVKKPTRVTQAPPVKPRKDSTAWLADFVHAGKFIPDAPQISSESSSSLVKDRCALLPLVLSEFCLPSSLVFVYQTLDVSGPPVDAVACLAPLGEEADAQIHKVTSAASACDALRAFVAPAEGKGCRWFIQLGRPVDVSLVLKWMAVNMPAWETSPGSLITCSS